MSQCWCAGCNKWSEFGCIYGDGTVERPFVYRCPNCFEAYELERRAVP